MGARVCQPETLPCGGGGIGLRFRKRVFRDADRSIPGLEGMHGTEPQERFPVDSGGRDKHPAGKQGGSLPGGPEREDAGERDGDLCKGVQPEGKPLRGTEHANHGGPDSPGLEPDYPLRGGPLPAEDERAGGPGSGLPPGHTEEERPHHRLLHPNRPPARREGLQMAA